MLRQEQFPGSDFFYPQSAPSQGIPVERSRVVTRESYNDLLRLADDGCPLVADLEDYDVVEKV